jgi:transposase
MGAALTIGDDLTPEALRRGARHEPDRRAALRMLAIANALEGMSRAEAARLAGMERQALRDAVVRYNAEGIAGLHDRPKPGRPQRLSEAEQAALAARVFRGPDPKRDGVAAWTRADLCGWLEARPPVQPVTGAEAAGPVAAEGPPRPPRGGPESAGALQKKGLCHALKATAAAHPDQRIALWFMDEARVGQKGRLCHRWWTRGRRPPGRCDKRFEWAYIFAAVEPATGADVALVLPEATTATMQLFLAEFAAALPQDVHAVLVLDGAGWHGARALAIPPNVTLVPLPPYSPELNPVERVWLYLRERFLSLRVFRDYRAILDACCAAWNRLVAEPGRLRSLCEQPWIRNVSS